MTLIRLLAALAALLLWAMPASAQRVDCGNGRFCPANHACLTDGNCARVVEVPAGATRMSNGLYCDPGWREGSLNPGKCIPPGYSECSAGGMCPNDTPCAPGGGCSGSVATGPMCRGQQCAAGRICSSAGCMNPAILHDCGNGTICPHAAVCELPSGCVYVAPQRFPQQR